MKHSDLLKVITSQFARTNKVPYLLLGPPGAGKSALSRDVAAALKFDRTVEFNASLRDPTDLLGTPRNNGEVTEWVPPKELYQLSTGRNLLILEELTDAQTAMQNGMCGLIYDRKINDLHLSDETYIIASGNRTEDKSGAQRLTTKLANRCRIQTYEVNIDDWSDWALNKGIDTVLVQFLRFRPNLLIDFDPNRNINPTPRAWERVNFIDTELPASLYFGECAGDVGEGAAAEFTAFRKIYEGLPNIDTLLMNPDKAAVPKDLAVLYALTGALASRSSKDNFDRVWQYVQRMPSDFQVMQVCDATKLHPEIKNTKGFVQFATKNANLMV